MIENPFLFSDDNKRYHTWNYYLKQTYHEKVFKVALNANFSCPNRDGRCGTGGCSFCGSLGSGEFAGKQQDPLSVQFAKGNAMMQKKWPNGKAIAYFQAFSNTYAPLSVLQKTYAPFMKDKEVLALSIATRADCLEDDTIAYLHGLTSQKDIWIELGLQSIHNETASRIHRGHTYETFVDCVQRLSKTNIKICVHIINSLPYESIDDMLQSAKAIGDLPIHAIKIHMLHVMKHTTMGKEYEEHPFTILTKDEYIDVVIRQLQLLPPTMIIQRICADGVQEDVIAPFWTRNKIDVLNSIDKEMRRRNTWQGKNYHQSLENIIDE